MLFHVLRHMNALKPQFDKTLEVRLKYINFALKKTIFEFFRNPTTNSGNRKVRNIFSFLMYEE